eukprot:7380706-Pyramimonas_sp.AAC.1
MSYTLTGPRTHTTAIGLFLKYYSPQPEAPRLYITIRWGAHPPAGESCETSPPSPRQWQRPPPPPPPPRRPRPRLPPPSPPPPPPPRKSHL